MARKCAVCGCTSTRPINGTTSTTSLFRFPKDPQRCMAWVECCDRLDLLDIYSVRSLSSSYYRVCGLHFQPSMFLNELKNRLQTFAIPNLKVDSGKGPVSEDLVEEKCNPPLSPSSQPTYASGPCYAEDDDSLDPIKIMDVESLSHRTTATQTTENLLAYFPCEEKLKSKIKRLQYQLAYVQQQRTREKSVESDTPTSLEEFKNLCDIFLSPTTAQSAKTEAGFSRRKHEGRRNSKERACKDTFFIYN